MKAKLIGIGAAGNKAAMMAIEKGVFTRDEVMLINTTHKDMKEEYADINVIIGSGMGGCGKERARAKKIALESLKEDKLNLDGIVNGTEDTVIIVSSSEGGTGCGASTIIAKYIREVLNVNVHLFVFTGFEDDARGLQNTVEYFQDIQDSFIVEAISNKKFLNGKTTKQEAEQLANEEFCRRMRAYLGLDLKDSHQNIDETDMYKINNTPGFMTIEVRDFDGIKKREDFDALFEDMIYNTKSLDFTKSSKRIGIFLFATEKTQSIGFDLDAIKFHLGEPFEFYTHIQTTQTNESVAIIASGMKLPTNDVNKVYEEYQARTANVDKAKDNFFDNVSSMHMNSEDAMFDLNDDKLANPTNDRKNDFFGKVEKETKEVVIQVGNKNKKRSKEEFLNGQY